MPADPLRDELGLEIERLVAIDPSPELRAQVRARIAGEERRAWWLPRWQLVGIGAAAAAAAAIIVTARVDVGPLPGLPSAPTLQLSAGATPHAAPVADIGLRKTTSRPGGPRVARQQVVLTVTPLEPLAVLAIEPVAIEPLGLLPPLSGERQ